MVWAAAGVLVAAIAGQAFWIGRAFDALRSELGSRLDRIEQRLDRIDNYGERIARLEERANAES